MTNDELRQALEVFSARALTYTLDDHDQPVPCDDPLEWASWMALNDRRRVAQDEDEGREGQGVRVSTIFTGVDMAHLGGPPVLWETMVFGGALDTLNRRYTSLKEALAGHQAICERVRESLRK